MEHVDFNVQSQRHTKSPVAPALHKSDGLKQIVS
jgi:hypothetical protein